MSDTERKRASLFGTGSNSNLNLEKFAPKKAPALNPRVVEDISQETGFTTKHAKSPQKRDGRRLKKSSRTSQFNVRLKPKTAERFWQGAETQGMEYADDFLEHLLNLYENKGK